MTAGAPALTALLDELDRLRVVRDADPRTMSRDQLRERLEASRQLQAAIPRLTAAVRAALALADQLERDADRSGAGWALAGASRRLRAAITAALEAAP